MARIYGSKRANTVRLVPPAEASSGQSLPGPVLSIALGQLAGDPFVWWFDVEAVLAEGVWRVGSVLSLAPDFLGPQQGQIAGQAPRRLVAYAYAPGAVGWIVTARAVLPPGVFEPPLTVNDAVAELYLGSSQGSLPEPGVVRVDALGRSSTWSEKDWQPAIISGASVAAPFAPYVTPGYLWTAYGESLAPTVTPLWLQAFDLAIAPAAGAVPKWSHLATPGNRAGTFYRGLRASTRLWVALSLTGPTYTPCAANAGFFQVETEAVRQLT